MKFMVKAIKCEGLISMQGTWVAFGRVLLGLGKAGWGFNKRCCPSMLLCSGCEPRVCLCLLPEHSLFPILLGEAIGILQKLAFPSLACQSRSAKAPLISPVSQNNLRPRRWQFIPRGPVCPTLSLHFSLSSLHSEAKVKVFIFSGSEDPGRAQAASPAASRCAQHRRLFQPCGPSVVLSRSPESANPMQGPRLSAQPSISPNGLVLFYFILFYGHVRVHFLTCQPFLVFLCNWLQKSQSYLYLLCICLHQVLYIFLLSC